eukprot:TRINITY_DN70465_c0_g1_i1.p1 TRINITY_DN70465_c0_g1~~TRINITY_DN70465_c0_g1_i1.p1  ORF type:complete len:349 (+),score=39.57 TRINITY_DN70465_c0_g1_i1:34-1047(+)
MSESREQRRARREARAAAAVGSGKKVRRDPSAPPYDEPSAGLSRDVPGSPRDGNSADANEMSAMQQRMDSVESSNAELTRRVFVLEQTVALLTAALGVDASAVTGGTAPDAAAPAARQSVVAALQPYLAPQPQQTAQAVPSLLHQQQQRSQSMYAGAAPGVVPMHQMSPSSPAFAPPNTIPPHSLPPGYLPASAAVAGSSMASAPASATTRGSFMMGGGGQDMSAVPVPGSASPQFQYPSPQYAQQPHPTWQQPTPMQVAPAAWAASSAAASAVSGSSGTPGGGGGDGVEDDPFDAKNVSTKPGVLRRFMEEAVLPAVDEIIDATKSRKDREKEGRR